ncbi:hypothetical protein GIB67_019841 [Kingdonia uniflora]|uniref:Uncharacterized protein n=1 Tax=Kingdonia uniflora TaxID=39325 RepID=A0A7J7MK68_9MAGN|nr:hypothetical protein GIB67_019841 [Kingdonia uniflora]
MYLRSYEAGPGYRSSVTTVMGTCIGYCMTSQLDRISDPRRECMLGSRYCGSRLIRTNHTKRT